MRGAPQFSGRGGRPQPVESQDHRGLLVVYEMLMLGAGCSRSRPTEKAAGVTQLWVSFARLGDRALFCRGLTRRGDS